MKNAARVLAALALLPALARAQGTRAQDATPQTYRATLTIRGMT